MRIGSTIALAVISGALFFPGCDRAPDWSTAVSLDVFDRERVSIQQEWRDAWRVPAGTTKPIKIADNFHGGFRVGLLRQDVGLGPVTVHLYVGSERVASLKSTEAGRWQDERVPLPKQPFGAPCYLVCENERDFWIGPCESFPATSPRPNVLIVLIDTLRLDHVSCYGHERPTTPSIDAFAKDAVQFTQAMPSSSWTRPSVASLLTGTYPNTHGAQDHWDRMRSDLPTLAKSLEQAGYETHGIMGNPNCLPVDGMGKEFFRYVDSDSADWKDATDGKSVDRAIETIRFAEGRPWFVYLHLMGPHGPYAPIPPFDTRFQTPDPPEPEKARAIDAYDGEIAYTDAQLARLFTAMKQLDEYDDALILITSDHGEEFWEHGGIEHGHTLYEEQLRVPFLLKLPECAHGGTTVNELIEQVDVAPTILESLGLPPEPRFEGRSFLPLIEGGEWDPKIGFASLRCVDKPMRAAKTPQLKFISDVGGTARWFDLVADPGESNPMRDAPAGGAQLAEYAAKMHLANSSGVHIVFAAAENEHHVVRGTVRGRNLGPHELRTSANLGSSRRLEDGLEFTVDLTLPHAAHLVVQAPLDDRIRIDFTVDGNPLPHDQLIIGSKSQRVPDEPGGVPVTAMADDTGTVTREPKPMTGVEAHCWYVPPADTFTRKDLDMETAEALRALGYLAE